MGDIDSVVDSCDVLAVLRPVCDSGRLGKPRLSESHPVPVFGVGACLLIFNVIKFRYEIAVNIITETA